MKCFEVMQTVVIPNSAQHHARPLEQKLSHQENLTAADSCFAFERLKFLTLKIILASFSGTFLILPMVKTVFKVNRSELFVKWVLTMMRELEKAFLVPCCS